MGLWVIFRSRQGHSSNVAPSLQALPQSWVPIVVSTCLSWAFTKQRRLLRSEGEAPGLDVPWQGQEAMALDSDSGSASEGPWAYGYVPALSGLQSAQLHPGLTRRGSDPSSDPLTSCVTPTGPNPPASVRQWDPGWLPHLPQGFQGRT